ncbi:C45 family autoproteolytic acyltransferase/hydolase [Streptosporangium sp. NPDC087985]|uniref:C45 family autoproteolytic acyltransferase/hydolase n=1 Tax=Streptosporangium sp. NPDC087985 TaxID=3366196 RepID=UPI0038242623
MNPRAHLKVQGTGPWQRGYDRGRQIGPEITRAWRTYAELFETAARGVTLDVPTLALGTVTATRAWAPELVEEMEGVAEGAGVPLWTVAALNARTEILAAAGTARANECSTVVHTGARTLGGQSWDWHEELAGAWHLQSVRGSAGDGTLGFTGITEYGILAKIGINEAGVGVLFNILGHVDDGVGGVPVHLVARRVLGSATSFADAVAILTDAPVSASTVMTVVTAEQAASVEVSPAGAAVVTPDGRGWLVRANHFLDPALAAGELRGRLEPETYDRLRVLRARVEERHGLDGADDLASLLTVHPGDGAEVCCHAPVGGALGTRWATLATVVAEPAAGRLMVHDGGPCTARPSTWTTLTAPSR